MKLTWPGCLSELTAEQWEAWRGVLVVRASTPPAYITVCNPTDWPRVVEAMFASGINQAWMACR